MYSKSIFKTLLIYLNPRQRKHKRSGFSLTEILMSTSLATVLISMLLYFMVDLMKNDQTEQARSTLNEEMKRALNYVVTEMRSATYVYDGGQLVNRTDILPNLNGLQSYLPSFGSNSKLILAFWKVEPVPYNAVDNLPANCATSFSNNLAKLTECNNLKTERRTYTLVVYVQTTGSSTTWPGESRIERFQLRKYSTLNTLTRTPGYVDPNSESTFGLWPLNSSGKNLQTSLPSINRETLVDFVARPSAPLQSGLTCSTEDVDGDEEADYVRSPYDNPSITTDDSNSFFACVRNSSGNVRYNQDVVIFLRGNAKGKPGIYEDSFLDVLQQRAINRGIVGKTVAD